MSTGQIHLFAYSETDDAAKASLLKALDPTSAVIVERNIHPAFSHPLDLALQRQVHLAIVQYGRALCRI